MKFGAWSVVGGILLVLMCFCLKGVSVDFNKIFLVTWGFTLICLGLDSES